MKQMIDHQYEVSHLGDEADLTVRLETAERYLANMMQYLQETLSCSHLSTRVLAEYAEQLSDAKQEGKTFLLPPDLVVYETDLRHLAENLTEEKVQKCRDQLAQKKAALQSKKSSLVSHNPDYAETLETLEKEALEIAKAEQSVSPEKIAQDRQRIHSAIAQLDTPKAKQAGVSLGAIASLLDDPSETLSYDLEMTPGGEPEATPTPQEPVFYSVSREITAIYAVVISITNTLQLIADLKWQAKQQRQQQLERLKQLAQLGQLSAEDQLKKNELEKALQDKQQRQIALEQRLAQLQQFKAEKPDQAAFIDPQINQLEEALTELTAGDDQAYTAESLLPALIKALPQMEASSDSILSDQLQQLEKIAYLLDISRSAYQITSLCAAVQYKQRQLMHLPLKNPSTTPPVPRWSKLFAFAYSFLLLLVMVGFMPQSVSLRVVLEIGIGAVVLFFVYRMGFYLHHHLLAMPRFEKQDRSTSPSLIISDETDGTTHTSLLLAPAYPEDNLDADRFKSDPVNILAALMPTLAQQGSHQTDKTRDEGEQEKVFYQENDVLPDVSSENGLQNSETAAGLQAVENPSEVQKLADHSEPSPESCTVSATIPLSVVSVASCADVLFWECAAESGQTQTQERESQQKLSSDSHSIEEMNLSKREGHGESITS